MNWSVWSFFFTSLDTSLFGSTKSLSLGLDVLLLFSRVVDVSDNFLLINTNKEIIYLIDALSLDRTRYSFEQHYEFCWIVNLPSRVWPCGRISSSCLRCRRWERNQLIDLHRIWSWDRKQWWRQPWTWASWRAFPWCQPWRRWLNLDG